MIVSKTSIAFQLKFGFASAKEISGLVTGLNSVSLKQRFQKNYSYLKCFMDFTPPPPK
jgi:hypothetical protein